MGDLLRMGRSFGRRGLYALLLFGLVAASPTLAGDEKPDATVEIKQTQIAFIGSGNLGGGKLFFQGKTYPFTIGGLGIGGFGVQTMTAAGNGYHLKDISQFDGAYAQRRAGVTLAAATMAVSGFRTRTAWSSSSRRSARASRSASGAMPSTSAST